MLYKEEVTKKELIKYLGRFDIIEIIPLKNDDPIFILKNRRSFIFANLSQKIIIHRGKFMWASKERIELTSDLYVHGDGQGIPLDEYPAYEDYPKSHRNKAYTSKDFSIKSILDKKLDKMQDKRYITPIRELFRKYEVLTDRRGIAPKISEVGKEKAICFTGTQGNRFWKGKG